MMKINKKNKKMVMAIIGVVVAAWTAYQNNSGDGSTDKAITSTSNLVYTKHAKCRMDCRYLNKSEVEDVLSNGKVNKRKSNPKASPCPVVAKEKRTKDKQLARVVYANCPNKIKIITVIDLDNKYSCTCD